MAQKIPPRPESAAASQLEQLLERAQGGDLEVLPALRQVLDEQPEIWQRCGNLAAHAELTWLRLVGGRNLLCQETVARKLAELKEELAGPAAPLLEKLLAERIALCWLQTQYLELEVANTQPSGTAHPASGDQLRKRLDSAHKRYLHAIKQLALVRKLLQRAPAPLEVAGRLPLRECPPRQADSGHRLKFAEARN